MRQKKVPEEKKDGVRQTWRRREKMGVAWTEEQQKVIHLRGRNLLVSAAAGSGKTAVLVERIITMLTDKENPVGVENLLVVTFTEAAAAEMKERIRDAIEKKLLQEPENEHLKQQATLIHNALITTIHSFCLSVIRDYFHVIDLDPGFRIGEEGELKLLRQEVLSDMLEEHYSAGEQQFLDFVGAYGGSRNDKKIEELVLKIYEFSRSYPDAVGWLENCAAAYEADTEEELEESKFVRLALERAKCYLADAKELLGYGLSLCREPDGPAAYEAAFLADARMVDGLLGEDSFAGLNRAIQKTAWERLAPNRDKSVSEEKLARAKAIRAKVKELVGDMASQYFYQDTQGILEDIRISRPHIKVLVKLAEEFADRFEVKKREKDMIDFSDMEQYALQILTERDGGEFLPSAVAREYQQQFAEVMIDEYQDSNLIQEAILTSVSRMSAGQNNIFMVGDVKQSIYRFRLSRPELFMEKFHTYSTSDGDSQRIDLHKNFRSRREALDSVNYLFRQIMTQNLGGIAYDEAAALHVGADYPQSGEGFEADARTEVLIIDSNTDDVDFSGEDDGEIPGGNAGGGKISERELEARAVAGRIRELVRKHQIVDKGTGKFRPVRYSDIVILVRSVKGFADVFSETLNKEGIPACTGTREGYFATQEIGVLLDYLRALDNWRQDIPLAAVLASPFGKMTEEELAAIKSAYKEEPFFLAVSSYREEGQDEAVRAKLESCLAQMERFRERVTFTPMHELLRKILADTGYGDFVSAMPGGEQRKANLDMLVEKAKAFEASSYKGLFHFVRYIEQLQKYDVDYGEAALEDEQSDTVRIMTIHKSKGLEFPVVFVAGMGKRFNMQDARSSAVLHAKLGIGLDAVDLERRTKSPSIIKKVIQKEEVLDSLGEELRVLYVAITRAREKLIITGTVPNIEKKLESCAVLPESEKGTLSFSGLSTAVTYWDWLLPALAHGTEESPIDCRRLAFADIVKEEVEEETAGRIKKEVLERWDAGRVYEPKVRETLEEQFGYSYAYEGSRFQKLKFTVSELKKRVHFLEAAGETPESAGEYGEMMYEEPEVVPLLPKFLQREEKLSGAPRGTAYHRLMELLDFRKEYTETSLKEEISRLCKEGRMTEEMADCIRLEDILAFLYSKTGSRIRRCAVRGTLVREQPFVLGVDASSIYPGESGGEMVLVQGIIDAYFQEPDGIVALDYKTDQIHSAQELEEKYHAQLDYYAKALEQVTGKKVKEKVIYSFTLAEEITVKRN